MLSIRLLRSNKELIIENLKKRNQEELISLVDECLRLDNEWRRVIKELNDLRKKLNELSKEYANKGDEKLIEEANRIKDEIEKLEKMQNELINKRDEILQNLPNLIHESVPYGKDERDNVPIKYYGVPKVKKSKENEFKENFPNLNYTISELEIPIHADLMENYKLIDTLRASKVSGSRFYYLKNQIVILNLSLIRYGIDFLIEKGFTIMQTPFLVREFVMNGATQKKLYQEDAYKISEEDLWLIPTSEFSILGYHANEILEEKELPLKYAGLSSCFRKEAGSHGKDTKGIFRVHQFEKVEQFIFCKPEESWEMHEYLIKNVEEFYQSLEIPYRIVNICSGDLGPIAAKKYDLEAWFPGQNSFRELVSCSNCLDYQARRVNIRFRRKNGEVEFVHTLNSTLVATERTICAIFENFFDGKGIEIPKKLVKYTGFDYINLCE
ncbi:MAG: serine--tRNA ligase [Candidatus Aenigmatarchaeota archaeon]